MDLEKWLDKADVVNIGALIALIVYVVLVVSHVYIALNSTEPSTVFKEVLNWAIPVFLGILQTYGLIKRTVKV